MRDTKDIIGVFFFMKLCEVFKPSGKLKKKKNYIVVREQNSPKHTETEW